MDNTLVIMPDIEYKLELIEALVKSITMDFSDDSLLKERHELAKKLTKNTLDMLEERSNKDYLASLKPLFDKYVQALKAFYETLEGFSPYEQDGRYFRYDFPDGYWGMLEFFGIDRKDTVLL